MATRKSVSDAYNNGPISYLDDVPFKVNEKFRCPAKVGLPVGFCPPDCSYLLADTKYDFSLENRSVRWGIELAEARAAEARAEEVTAQQEAEDSAQAQDVNGSGGKPRSALDDQDPPPPAMNPVLAGLSHGAILTPLPAPSLGPRKIQPSTPQPHSLNLADFEREEDPFDKLELKTLDDKEELRNILQSQPQPAPSVSPPEVSQLGPTSRGNSPSPPSNTSLPAKPGFAHKPNGLVSLLDMDKVGHHGRSGYEAEDRPCNIRSLTFPKLSDSGDSDPVRYSPFPAPIPAPRHNLPNGSPPILPTSQVIVAPEPLSLDKGGGPKPGNSVSGSAGLPCGGALLSMTPSERQCVETLVGMGYSYEGVLRAMQRQGQNVEQVLDYLFVHGRLCERGFDASAVEECLEMYQCSEEKALQFLELMSRFGEMGFKREAIKEVLLVHNNDQDKALEDLMARAAAS
ncbi:ubiquitin-associated protein 1 [Entelurus aequoreus]|uniref:ubiquitin-associated protein 1 n=1 Tax=Entelurus aequoreus TaxID=161455 RepID=UPI002B1DCC5F|nr:ubiquitin-associated protein 1 [Entelurus aequoreus]XP_061919189.1 ubiquitin-associated protein 1 [Entelurus aequoreus]XP_061919196.1 ubiquitin-associated protein 1 [Entelurus aequoreus]XP_061919205.1 ubiquitin-associated protein 1 [Entelurus aequoreus]